MANKTLIDLAYELAKTKYKDKAFTFEQLWKELVKKCRLDKDEQNLAGHIYTTMLQDHRFIFTGNGEWKIREFLKLDEQQTLSNALYDFKSAEEDLDDDEKAKLASLNDKEMLDQEMYYDDETLEEMYYESKNKLDDEPDEEEEEEDSQEINEQEEE